MNIQLTLGQNQPDTLSAPLVVFLDIHFHDGQNEQPFLLTGINYNPSMEK